MDNVFLVMLLEMFIEDFQACYLPFRKAHTNVLYQVQLQHVCTSIWFSGHSSNCSVAYILTVMIMKEIPNKPAYAGKDKNSNLGYVSARTHVFEAH